jgi:hypothetical protein
VIRAFRAAASLVLASLATACAAPPPAAVSVAAPAKPAAPALRNSGFEEPTAPDLPCPAGWRCTAHVDVGSFAYKVAGDAASGKSAMCIERTGKEPWALATQAFHTTAMRGQRLRLSMAVRAQGLEGGAGPWIESQGGRAHAMNLVKSTRGWERVSVEIAIPAESNLLVVGATLEGGGMACFDDVRLEVL